ncbi:MAG: Rid family detoxifying hydrolase [Elainellaceae cyanobacterium]
MTKSVIQTDRAPAPVGPYSQAVAVTGQLVFVAGQIPLAPQGGGLVDGDVGQQTEQALRNLEAVVQAAGATLADVVKTTVFLADMDDFAAMNAVYAKFFDVPVPPARACVEVSRLPKDVRVEIDCIAAIAA